MSLDITDRKLLNLIQSDFPLHREPYAALSDKLGVSEDEVLQRIQRLRDKGIIRSISAIYNAAGLGYHSTLVAMHVDEAHVDEAAAFINRHMEVSHNYLRDHYLNLWFTLTTTRDRDLEDTAAKMGESVDAEITLSLPIARAFKINVCFDMLDQEDDQNNGDVIHLKRKEDDNLTEDDIALVCELQRDLPLEAQPFNVMADSLGLELDDFLQRAASFKERGIMRRYGARLDHYQVGIVANALSCWLVPPERLVQVGNIIAGHRKVSHCYERQTAPQWPYSLYAMIHGYTEEESRSVALQLSEESGISDYILLRSTKEYLKRRILYFTG
jgi:DNA-binding Lrp family transcriptional regulator